MANAASAGLKQMTSRSPFAVATVLTLLAMALTGSMTALPTERVTHKEIFYSVDMEQLRSEFRETGQIHLRVPDYGELVFHGTVSPVREGNQWSELLENGTVVLHEDLSIPLDVTVGAEGVGYLLLGEHGVYGRISFPDEEVLFDPAFHEESSEFEQGVSLTHTNLLASLVEEAPPVPADFAAGSPSKGGGSSGASGSSAASKGTSSGGKTASTSGGGSGGGGSGGSGSACSTPPVPQSCTWPCTKTVSYVQVDVDESMKSARPDWRDRVTAAFKGHHGSYEMWKDICLELLMKVGSPRDIGNIGTHTNTGEALSAYTSWLNAVSTRTTESSGYNLFTGRDLYGCPDHDPFPCPGNENNGVIGVSRIDRAVRSPSSTASGKADQALAVSIVEGKRYGGSGSYDPGRDWDMARVDGHELSHLFGEYNHRSHCKSSSNCNIMEEFFAQRLNTYWIDSSRCEVYRWFFHSDPVYTAGEGCPNWYAP